MKKSVTGFMFCFASMLMYCSYAQVQVQAKPRKCIMVFGAHADDVESLAGGTFAKYIAMGYEAVYVDVINNLAGCSLEKTPYFKLAAPLTVSSSPHAYPVDALETSQIREEEARAAANVFGAIPVFLNYNEPWFSMGREQIDYGTEAYTQFAPVGRPLIALATIMSNEVNYVVDLFKKYQPEIVIIHTLGGEKLDHGNAAYMTYLAFKRAINQKVAVGKLWMSPRGWLSPTETGRRKTIKPDIRINVKAFLKTKYEAYDKHTSQNGGLGMLYFLSNRSMDYNDEIEEFITVLDNTK
jgi:LmbE family N-acetylglucosaminyl deacetylase